MKVSVIIPAYNEEKYIGKCLESLKHQEEPADEIIVIDNNCKDKTAAIAKKYGVKVVHEKKQGMIQARNRGFNDSKYEIIARCDADVILPPHWIKKIKSDFTKRKVDALLGPVKFYDLFLLKASIFSKLFIFWSRIVNRKHILIGPNMALTRMMWEKVRDDVCLSDKKVQEDIDLALHIKEHHGTIYYDKLLTVSASARRIKHNPLSFFIVYPARSLETFLTH